MKIAERRRGAVLAAIGIVLACLLQVGMGVQHPAAAAGTEQAKELDLRIDPSRSQVHWTLGSTLHTVHGTFVVKSGDIRIDTASGKAGGEVVIDAASGESGNDGRDKKMHREIIESAKYKVIAFRPDRVEGHVAAQGRTSVQIHGMFAMHGAEHEITVPVQAELTGDHWKGSGKFSVPYIDWGLKSPNNLFLKADKKVEVELELAGALERAGGQ